jgi:tetratricopeptide (TPR) repeat protein
MGFEVAMKANHAYSISIASFGLAQGWIRQGRFADAIRVLEQGLEQTKLHSVEAAVDQVVSRLVYAYSRAGQIEEARTLGQTIELAHFSFLSSSHFLLAGIGLENDRIDQTLQAARELHQAATLRGERGIIAWLEHLLGDLAMGRDPADTSAAAGHYRVAATIADELGMRPLAMECHLGLGAVARQEGRENEAQSEFQSALELAKEMGILSAADKARQQLQTT